MPHFFTEESIAASADTFPVELLDIAGDKQILFGRDAFSTISSDKSHLRLQCERELREKLMRLQESYVESSGRPKELSRLLINSYLSFTQIFRGCLRLLDADVPARADEIMTSLCTLADLDPFSFGIVDRLARGQVVDANLDELFADYYEQLTKAVQVVDLLEGQKS